MPTRNTTPLTIPPAIAPESPCFPSSPPSMPLTLVNDEPEAIVVALVLPMFCVAVELVVLVSVVDVLDTRLGPN